MAALLTRMVRATLLEELRKEYVTAAIRAGSPPPVRRRPPRAAQRPRPRRHGAGAVVRSGARRERHHGDDLRLARIGRLLIQAIDARDYPLVQGCVLVIALSTVAVNLATDILCARLDPRIRYE